MSKCSEMNELSGARTAPLSSGNRQSAILSGLAPSQAEASTPHGAVPVLAGAGKTRTLSASYCSRWSRQDNATPSRSAGAATPVSRP